MKSRKTGRIVLIAACIIAVVIGFARKPSYIQVDDNTESSTYVYDEAGVLDSDAVNAVEDANSRMDATLYVVTVEDTGSYSTEEYCYNWQESHSLSQTSCELLIVTDDDSYWFIYGSSLAGVLDYSYGTLLDQYYVPYTDYSKAVEKFSDALADLFEESDYSAVGAAAEYSGNGGSVIAQILIAVVLIIIIIALVKAFTRRNYYWWGYNYPKPWYVPMWWWNRRPPHY
ncbi:MAG: TPM domain-containing protein, partial [Oscillospiraceae bacterium]